MGHNNCLWILDCKLAVASCIELHYTSLFTELWPGVVTNKIMEQQWIPAWLDSGLKIIDRCIM